MAVIESIPEKNQTPSAQKGVLDYCMQPSKTLDEDEQLAYISGYNCIPELANESFLATWFLREEYLTAGWFKRLLLRIEFVFRDTRGESHLPQLPPHIITGQLGA